MLGVPLQGSGLATNALVRKSLDKALQAQVVVPCLGESLVLLVKLHKMHVVAAHDVTAPLLDAQIIVAKIERGQVRDSGHTKLEAHLRVAHEVAVLFAIVSNGKRGESNRAGLVDRLDDKLHVRDVVDLEIEAGVPPSGHLEDLKDGLHYATRASSASGIVSVADGSNAARMTAEVC